MAVRRVFGISESEFADELVEALFQELDKDGSGDIDVAELVWFIENTRPDGSRTLPAAEADASKFLAEAAASRRPDQAMLSAPADVARTRSYRTSSLRLLSPSPERLLQRPSSGEMDRAVFTAADVGKTVSIRGDVVHVEGELELREVAWGTARHEDCTGKIRSVEPCVMGKVQLEGGPEFENPRRSMAWMQFCGVVTNRHVGEEASARVYHSILVRAGARRHSCRRICTLAGMHTCMQGCTFLRAHAKQELKGGPMSGLTEADAKGADGLDFNASGLVD